MIFEESLSDILALGQDIVRLRIVTLVVVTRYYPTQTSEIYTQEIGSIYGTLTGAENYFRGRIKSTVRDWLDAEYEDKMAALRTATRLIENLNFKGCKVDSEQRLHFPTVEAGTPSQIALACYEIALRLLEGINPDTEADNLSVTSQGYAGGRSSFDRSFVQEHIRANIPSATAWSILRPYLCDPLALSLRRGA